MYIQSLKLAYFKGFSNNETRLDFSIPNGELGSGLNILIGENNSGKSTVFEAISFLRDETKEVNRLKNKQADNTQPNEASVELTFYGEIENVISQFSPANKKEAFLGSIYDNKLTARRCTENYKEITLWDESESRFRNITGISAPFKKLFENNFIWADTNPSDEASFGSSTMCGTLLKEIALTHNDTDEYREFMDSFENVFNNPTSELRQQISAIEDKIQSIFTEQFGSARIQFRFDKLDIALYFKNVELMIDDGIETAMSEKGHGMQRALALALLQVYAQTLAHVSTDNTTKPFYLFIDEPELCLHPRGQKKLFDALLEISRTKQVFLTTHSPYFLISPCLRNSGIFVFENDGTGNLVQNITVAPTFPWSPTWGEINYKAYKIPTVEFHNELYGYLQHCENKMQEKEFEPWLAANGLATSKTWIREKNNQAMPSYNVTLQTFIRHKIHHPENRYNPPYTYEELKQSIDEMIDLI